MEKITWFFVSKDLPMYIIEIYFMGGMVIS